MCLIDFYVHAQALFGFCMYCYELMFSCHYGGVIERCFEKNHDLVDYENFQISYILIIDPCYYYNKFLGFLKSNKK